MELLFPGVEGGGVRGGRIWPLPVQPCVYYGIGVFKQLDILDSKTNELHFHACTLTSMYKRSPGFTTIVVHRGSTGVYSVTGLFPENTASYPVNSCPFAPNRRSFRNKFRLPLLEASTGDRMRPTLGEMQRCRDVPPATPAAETFPDIDIASVRPRDCRKPVLIHL